MRSSEQFVCSAINSLNCSNEVCIAATHEIPAFRRVCICNLLTNLAKLLGKDMWTSQDWVRPAIVAAGLLVRRNKPVEGLNKRVEVGAGGYTVQCCSAACSVGWWSSFSSQ